MTDPLPVVPVPFAGHVANVSGRSIEIAVSPPGPPRRIDGYSVGVVPVDTGPGPHDGEMHPDGDEFLHVISGAMEVLVDDGDEESIGSVTTVLLQRGDACVVPRGLWHRVVALEPGLLLHVTPGPNGPARIRGER